MNAGRLILLLILLFESGLAAGQASGPRADFVQLGLRPYLLVQDMAEGPLKERLMSCATGPFRRSDFSIGHRGAPLLYPEHTRESYEAAVRMGAGIVECDVTFTQDKALVCRHSQCDLHTTTNILTSDLAERCRETFQPAVFDEDGTLLEPARAQCCTSDITLKEFKQLQGKRDAFNPEARTPQEFVTSPGGGLSKGTLLTHAESITLLAELGVKMAPELKSPSVAMPFRSMSRAAYAQALIDEYKAAGIDPRQVFPQSFDLADVRYWLEHEPAFARQAVFLDDRDSSPDFDHRNPATWQPGMEELAAMGVKILAPPLWMLLEDDNGRIGPSLYATRAKAAGLELIAWSLERSGSLRDGGGWYYQTLTGDNPPEVGRSGAQGSLLERDGDVYEILQVLARGVGVRGVFSDWPATVTYYANCMGIE